MTSVSGARTAGAPPPDAARTVADVVDLYDRFAGGTYDEAVSQLDHALQTAALARAATAPPRPFFLS